MLQFYFLSIFCNGLTGYILFAGGNENTEFKNDNRQLAFPFFNPTFHLVLAIISAITGVIKLFLTVSGVPFFGDIAAALAGLLASFILVFGIYRRDLMNSVNRESALDILGEKMLFYRKPIGLVLLAAALLHFLFPRVLFL